MINFICKNYAQLSSGGGGSVTGAASPTLADVVIFASLYPLLASSPEAPAAAAADLPRATVAWFDALATGNASFAAGCAAAKANASTAANLCAADGQALLLEQLSKAPTKDPSGEKFNITTAINYANGVPHMGHAYEARARPITFVLSLELRLNFKVHTRHHS